LPLELSEAVNFHGNSTVTDREAGNINPLCLTIVFSRDELRYRKYQLLYTNGTAKIECIEIVVICNLYVSLQKTYSAHLVRHLNTKTN